MSRVLARSACRRLVAHPRQLLACDKGAPTKSLPLLHPSRALRAKCFHSGSSSGRDSAGFSGIDATQLFEECDQDQDGLITTDELHAALEKRLGNVGFSVSEMAERWDADGNGKLDLDEFLGMVQEIDMHFPALKSCRTQPRSYHAMSSEVLMLLAASGDHGARRERLIREIMYIDKKPWPEARDQADAMSKMVADSVLKDNNEDKWIRRASFFVIPSSALMGFASLPLVFHGGTAKWFHDAFVEGIETPPESDIDTILEVGSWTWNWMEPPIGTISFVILCVQLTYAHGMNVLRSDWYRTRNINQRTEFIIHKFPQYNTMILRHWSETLADENRVRAMQ